MIYKEDLFAKVQKSLLRKMYFMMGCSFGSGFWMAFDIISSARMTGLPIALLFATVVFIALYFYYEKKHDSNQSKMNAGRWRNEKLKP
jgi:Ca2+/Na+ antiporter